jgi:hypothetical protein
MGWDGLAELIRGGWRGWLEGIILFIYEYLVERRFVFLAAKG